MSTTQLWDQGFRPIARGASFVLEGERKFVLMRAGKMTNLGKHLAAARGWQPYNFNTDQMPRRTTAESRVKNMDGSESVIVRYVMRDGS